LVCATLFELDYQILSAISVLQPSPMEILSSAGPTFTLTTSLAAVTTPLYLPYVPLEIMGNASLMDKVADVYSEALLMEVFNLGSVLGTSLSHCDPRAGATMIVQLLDSGFAYVVASGGKMLQHINLFEIKKMFMVLMLICRKTNGSHEHRKIDGFSRAKF
jgi:hypothetical protein